MVSNERCYSSKWSGAVLIMRAAPTNQTYISSKWSLNYQQSCRNHLRLMKVNRQRKPPKLKAHFQIEPIRQHIGRASIIIHGTNPPKLTCTAWKEIKVFLSCLFTKQHYKLPEIIFMHFSYFLLKLLWLFGKNLKVADVILWVFIRVIITKLSWTDPKHKTKQKNWIATLINRQRGQ